MNRLTVAAIRSLLLFIFVPANCHGDELRILPEVFHLDGRESAHRILLEGFDGDQATGPAEQNCKLTSDDETVARIENDRVIPVANGQTVIRATANGADVGTANVTVTNTQERFQWTFRNHVQSVLARQGCNSGACHGALAGKGGFKLSLRGYDTDRDHFNTTTQQLGRRIDLRQPALSLLLTKPTTAVPHKGGQRIETSSLNYKVLAEWIADGAPAPSEEDARLVSLTMLPTEVTLVKGQVQPLIVQAHYSDGRIEDVTQWGKFTSANEAVATVDVDGIATVLGPGEGAISAWFGSQIVIGRITSPFEQSIAPDSYVLAGSRNFIDDLVLKQLRRLNLKPSPLSTDEVFVRRAFLDTIGTLPTSLEVREFLADGSPGKRDSLIE